MRTFARSLACRVLAVALASGACGGATRPELDQQRAAGAYVLETVRGRGPVSGTFVLTRSGSAERRVRYDATPSGTIPDYVAIGTFRLHPDGTIEFALREDGGRSPYIWPPRGQHSGSRFSIRYPDPADGPDIVEIYRRQ